MSAVGRTAAVMGPAAQPGGRGAVLWVLVAVFIGGAGSLVYALTSEEMQPDFVFFTVSFLYLMGISQAGVVFCAIMRLVGAQWSKPYYRLAELVTLAFCPFAFVAFLLIYFYAQEDLFHWLAPDPDAHLSPWLDADWLFIRNLSGLLLFYGLSAVYVLKALRPDLRGGPSSDHRALERELRVMSPFVIVAFVICNTFFAWDFGMMIVEHWYSTVFPIFVSFGNLFAGSAALILFAAALGRTGVAPSHFGPSQIRSLGMVITGFTLIWLYLFWAQFFVTWFGNLPRETEPLWRQMYGHYAPYYWAMMSACFFIPFVAFVFAVVKRSLFLMCLLALCVNVGIWLNKYLVVIPVFSPNDVPFDSWLDVSLAVGLLAGFLAVLVALLKPLPVYSYWEIGLEPEPWHGESTT